MRKVDIEDRIELIFRKNMVAHCAMWLGKDEMGNFIGQFQTSLPITFRENEIGGILNHEISTHYLRGYNERK